jgi:DNA-binding MarR family transcriptional regulator
MAKTSNSAYDLKSSPSHLLHRTQQFAADRFTSALGDDPITQRQFAVLVAVAAMEGLTQTDLVNATGIDRSTLAELVARMAKNGLLKRTRAKNDARANTVSLTPKGKALFAKALPKVKKADDAIMSLIPKTKQSGFLATLQEYAAALDADDSAPVKAKPKKGRK